MTQLVDLEYSELTLGWRRVPDWVSWFLRLGYKWNPATTRRRICVVSAPCDSPGAALIALGLLRRRLCVPDAGDLASHLLRLRRLFETARADTLLRYRSATRKRFRFTDPRADGSLQVSPEGHPEERHIIVEEFAYDWCVDGEPHPVAPRGRPLQLPLALLNRLIPGACPILPENLASTDSAICFAGSVTGESRATSDLSDIRFRLGIEEHSLGSLLAIHGWHEGAVSRMVFYNGRTGKLDREVRVPLAVCVNGGQTLLEILDDTRRFGEADIIGVVPRTSDPDLLNRVSQKLSALSQWYTRDSDAGSYVDHPPHGVASVALIRE